MTQKEIRQEAEKILNSISIQSFLYITNHNRKEYFGFGALHDLCDANMLLPVGYSIEDYNMITDEFNNICHLWLDLGKRLP